MNPLAAIAIVAALAGCASSDQEPSFASKAVYGLSAGAAAFGDSWGANQRAAPAPSLQPQRCYVSGDWVTCYPY